jgi:ADP-ribosyl-[dinitrogen reductase] hydrolase
MVDLFKYEKTKHGRCNIGSSPILDFKETREIDELINYSIIGEMTLENHHIRSFMKNFWKNNLKNSESKAIAAMLGLVIGDALGAPMEFLPVRYNDNSLIDMKNDENKFNLKCGQWTDDGSMAQCLCDSLLCTPAPIDFDPIDSMLRYVAWWHFGYNNAFKYDTERKNRHSVGLGGNISDSMNEFIESGEPFTKAGNNQTSGNGSLMRLAPVAIAFHRNVEKCVNNAMLSSYVTHQGIEAAECCGLLAYIMSYGISSTESTTHRKFLDELPRYYKSSKSTSVNYLIASQCEPSGDVDRNWNWKDANFKYSPSRSKNQPNYIGSYAMDAMAMSLHCFYTTNSYKSCVLKAANLGGDADTVACISGQLAGSFYGLFGEKGIPEEWIEHIQKWDGGGSIAYRASLLYHKYSCIV